MISLTQIFLLLFLLFALSRVVLRFRGGALSIRGFVFWLGLFSFAIVTVLEPKITGSIANYFVIGRGADAVIYVSLVLLFYLIFRLHIFIEDLRHDITTLVGKLSMREFAEKNGKKISKN